MRKGRIVFDGSPAQLTTGAARDIYGAGADFSEAMTSTALEPSPPITPDRAYAERLMAD
jgi:phosphonate transport system ATP-binding protein